MKRRNLMQLSTTSKTTGMEDFSNQPVPTGGRHGAFAVFVVWLGFIVVVGTMAAGGGLAAQAHFSDILIGIFIGNLILGILAFLGGWVGAHSGMTFYQLGERVFGSRSMRLVGLYVPIVLIGWFGVEAAILGGFLGKVFGLSEALQRVLMFVAALIMTTSAYLGFKAIRNLSFVLIPIVFILGFFAILQSDLGGLEAKQVLTGEPKGALWVSGIVVSTWIMGVVLNLPDVTRFAKSPLQGALIGFLGILVGNIFNLMIGATAAINTGKFDPSEILLGLGFIPLALVLATANVWSTNDNNMYSATLGVARSFRIPRHTTVIICGLIGAVFAAFNPATITVIFTFLIAVGSTAPALGGVVLGAYFARMVTNKEYSIPYTAWVGWVGGSLIGILVGDLAGILLAFSVGALCSVLGYTVFSRKNK